MVYWAGPGGRGMIDVGVGSVYTATRGQQAAVSDRLYAMNCSACGVLFAIPDKMDNARRDDGATFYCPNGHGQCYRKTTEDVLREQLEREKRDRAAERDRLLDQVNTERRAHVETERDRRRIIGRVDAGVCPDCNRHFTDLQRHREGVHGAHGGGGSPSSLTGVMLVHKRRGRWALRSNGTVVVHCGAGGIPQARGEYRWRSVTCPDCLNAPGAPADPAGAGDA